MLELDGIFGDGSLTFSNSAKRAVPTSDGVRSRLFAATFVKGGMLLPSSKLGVWTMNGVTRGIFINAVNQLSPQWFTREEDFLPP